MSTRTLLTALIALTLLSRGSAAPTLDYIYPAGDKDMRAGLLDFLDLVDANESSAYANFTSSLRIKSVDFMTELQKKHVSYVQATKVLDPTVLPRLDPNTVAKILTFIDVQLLRNPARNPAARSVWVFGVRALLVL